MHFLDEPRNEASAVLAPLVVDVTDITFEDETVEGFGGSANLTPVLAPGLVCPLSSDILARDLGSTICDALGPVDQRWMVAFLMTGMVMGFTGIFSETDADLRKEGG